MIKCRFFWVGLACLVVAVPGCGDSPEGIAERQEAQLREEYEERSVTPPADVIPPEIHRMRLEREFGDLGSETGSSQPEGRP